MEYVCSQLLPLSLYMILLLLTHMVNSQAADITASTSSVFSDSTSIVSVSSPTEATFITSFTNVRSNTTISTTTTADSRRTTCQAPGGPSPTIASQPPGRGVSDLTTAGKAGIGVGVGVAGTIVISVFIYRTKKRRGRKTLHAQKPEMVSNTPTVRRQGKRSNVILQNSRPHHPD